MANIPQALPELRDLSLAVATHWATVPAITLVHTTQAAFAADAGDLADLINGRITTGSTRPLQTRIMHTLDANITTGLPNVKAAIAAKWGADAATAYYPRFGLVHRSDAWIIPPDHNERVNALAMMVAAITTLSLTVLTYDLAYWTSLHTQYAAAFAAANTIDGQVSETIGSRDEVEARVRRVLVSLLYVLKGNYPETYKEVYRAWGFQAEDYG